MAEPRLHTDETDRLAYLEEEVRRLKLHSWGEGSGAITIPPLVWEPLAEGDLGAGCDYQDYADPNNPDNVFWAYDDNFLYLKGNMRTNSTLRDPPTGGPWTQGNMLFKVPKASPYTQRLEGVFRWMVGKVSVTVTGSPPYELGLSRRWANEPFPSSTHIEIFGQIISLPGNASDPVQSSWNFDGAQIALVTS